MSEYCCKAVEAKKIILYKFIMLVNQNNSCVNFSKRRKVGCQEFESRPPAYIIQRLNQPIKLRSQKQSHFLLIMLNFSNASEHFKPSDILYLLSSS